MDCTHTHPCVQRQDWNAVSSRAGSLEQQLLAAVGEPLLALNAQPYPYESFVRQCDVM